MTTKELIDAALASTKAKAETETALAAATTAEAHAATDLAASNKAVHDDLAANGQALYLTADTPPAYQVATSVDPDTFALTPIRIA